MEPDIACELLEKIRERPGIYLGEKDLTRLRNLLELGREKIRVGNMLPAMFLPIVYIPLAEWLSNLVKIVR